MHLNHLASSATWLSIRLQTNWLLVRKLNCRNRVCSEQEVALGSGNFKVNIDEINVCDMTNIKTLLSIV